MVNEIVAKKRCNVCREEKDFSCFSRQKSGKFGLRSFCKACRKHTSSRMVYVPGRPRNIEADRRAWKKRRFKKYGINEVIYTEMASKNDGLCAICNKRRHSVIDHCHATGRVRGLLCGKCNLAIATLGDDAEGVSRALAYLSP